MKNRSIFAAAVAAQATTDAATLTQVLYYLSNGQSPAGTPRNIMSSTATWTYDDITNLLAQTGDLYNVRTTNSPVSTVFRQSITGLVIGNGAAATAATYVCTEGNLGGNVGASICGNYGFGANFFNGSTTSWWPGHGRVRDTGGRRRGLWGPQLVGHARRLYHHHLDRDHAGPQQCHLHGQLHDERQRLQRRREVDVLH